MYGERQAAKVRLKGKDSISSAQTSRALEHSGA